MRFIVFFGISMLLMFQGCSLRPTLSEDFGVPFEVGSKKVEAKKISWIALESSDLTQKCNELIDSKRGLISFFFVGNIKKMGNFARSFGACFRHKS